MIDRFVVGAVITDKGKVLLLERPENDFMGGIFELPSGKVEEGEDLITALKREVKEETGLEVKEIIKKLESFDYKSKSGKKTRQFNFLVSVKSVEKIRLSEHSSCAWVSKKDLKYFPVTDSVKKVLSFGS